MLPKKHRRTDFALATLKLNKRRTNKGDIVLFLSWLGKCLEGEG